MRVKAEKRKLSDYLLVPLGALIAMLCIALWEYTTGYPLLFTLPLCLSRAQWLELQHER